MKKNLLFALVAALSLGTTATRATASIPTTREAVRRPVTEMVPLDLTKYGAPIIMQVPVGTEVEKWDEKPDLLGVRTIYLKGPEYRVIVNVHSAEGLEYMGNTMYWAKRDLADDKKSTLEINEDAKIIVDEPLANRVHFGDGSRNDDFMVMVPDMGRKKYYKITRHFNGGDPFPNEKVDEMYASAYGAKLIPKAPTAAPVKKGPAKAPVKAPVKKR